MEESLEQLYWYSHFSLKRHSAPNIELFCYFFLTTAARAEFLQNRQGAFSLQHANISPMCVYSQSSQGLVHWLVLETALCPISLEAEMEVRLSEGRSWSSHESVSVLKNMLTAVQYAATQIAST